MTSALVRKVSAVSVSRSPIPDIEFLGNRFVRGLEDSIRPEVKASIAGMVLEAEVTKLSTVTEGIAVPAMLGILELPGAGNQALVNVSADLAYHAIDLMMGGDAGSCPQPTTRSFTAIDCSLCERLLLAAAASFTTAVENSLDGPLDISFGLREIKQNITDVNIAPQNADILYINASLDIGDAARGGDIDIIVPLSVLDLLSASVTADGDDLVSVNDVWRKRMRRAVEEAEIPLTAVLHREAFTPNFLRELEVGMVLPIPAAAPSALPLIMDAGTKKEQHVGTAQLGAFDGRKVVKLNDTPAPTVIEHLKTAIRDG